MFRAARLPSSRRAPTTSPRWRPLTGSAELRLVKAGGVRSAVYQGRERRSASRRRAAWSPFELLEAARSSPYAWLERQGGTVEEYAFPSRTDHAHHLGTRQYARTVDENALKGQEGS